MSINADTLRRLASLKLAPEAMAEVLSIIADIASADDNRKKKDRERKRVNRDCGMSVEIPRNVQGMSEKPSPPSSPPFPPLSLSPTPPNPIPPISPLSSSPSGRASRATRLPENWILPDDYRSEALTRGLSNQEIDRQAERMLNWSRSSKNGVKLDWKRTWINWIDGAHKGRDPPRQTDKGGFASLLAKQYGLKDHGRKEVSINETVSLLPIGKQQERGSSGRDDGSLPTGSIGLLISNSVRSM